MMINCSSAKHCYYQYPSAEILRTSENVFLETFGQWPGIGLVVVTMARSIFVRVIWSFYLPWPWSVYLMLASALREVIIGNAFKGMKSIYHASVFILNLI